MLIHVLLFAIGFVLLIKGGDWFVDGAVDIAHFFHMPELLIGATVVSIGTTLPEVIVSSASAVAGHGEIAYGNAIGSIICNAALISAISIIVSPSSVDRKTLKLPLIFFFTAASFYIIVSYTTGFFSRWIGIVLLILFLLYMVLTVRQMKNSEDESENDVKEEVKRSIKISFLLLFVGAVLIAIGARLLIDHGTAIAQAAGIPESVIGLTLIALGTSLPELITAIQSLRKGHGTLSLGNIIGANLFNLVLVGGLSITLSPFPVPQTATLFGKNAALVLDLPLMMAIMLILTVPAVIKGKLEKWQGILMLILYIGFCIIQFTR